MCCLEVALGVNVLNAAHRSSEMRISTDHQV